MNKIDKILERACNAGGVGTDEVRSADRRDGVVFVRRLFCWEARKAGYTLAEIGKQISRDHATVMNSLEVAENLIEIGDRRMVGLLDEYARIGWMEPVEAFWAKKKELMTKSRKGWER